MHIKHTYTHMYAYIIYIYIYMRHTSYISLYIYIYIYIHTHTRTHTARRSRQSSRTPATCRRPTRPGCCSSPWRLGDLQRSLPTKTIPANIAWLKLSGEFPMDIKLPPLNNSEYAWVKPSEIQNLSSEIGSSPWRLGDLSKMACRYGLSVMAYVPTRVTANSCKSSSWT